VFSLLILSRDGINSGHIKCCKDTVTIHYRNVISMCLIHSRSFFVMFKRILIAAFLAASAPAFGQSIGLPAEGEILSGWREEGGRHMAGLSIRLAPGWKTYWRAPGDGGIPPRFNWSGSRNLAGVHVHFPVPEVMDQNGLRTIGYDGDVVFPLVVAAADASQPVQIRGEIELGVCEEICIPVTLQVSGLLPAGGAHDAQISAGIESRPSRGGSVACEIEPIADGLRVRAVADVPSMDVEAAVVEGSERGVWISQPVLKRKGNRLMAEVEMVPPTGKPFALARSDVRLTVIGSDGAVEYLGCQ